MNHVRNQSHQSLTADRDIHAPPPALAGFKSVAEMIAQAEKYERFAARETCLSEIDARDYFWRAAAALRIAARLFGDDFQKLAAYCADIDQGRRHQS